MSQYVKKVTCKKLSKYFSYVPFLHSVKENPTVVKNIQFLDVTHFQFYAYTTKNYMWILAPKITATPYATHSMRPHFNFRNDMGTTTFPHNLFIYGSLNNVVSSSF